MFAARKKKLTLRKGAAFGGTVNWVQVESWCGEPTHPVFVTQERALFHLDQGVTEARVTGWGDVVNIHDIRQNIPYSGLHQTFHEFCQGIVIQQAVEVSTVRLEIDHSPQGQVLAYIVVNGNLRTTEPAFCFGILLSMLMKLRSKHQITIPQARWLMRSAIDAGMTEFITPAYAAQAAAEYAGVMAWLTYGGQRVIDLCE